MAFFRGGHYYYLFFYYLLFLHVSSGDTSSEGEQQPRRWCHRDWPARGGRWTWEPPYWETEGCPNQAFGTAAATECMKGRTLYVIGNSVARQMAFGMVEVLGGLGVKRENQRDSCPKHETTWGDSCHQEFAGVKIRYLFIQFMDGFFYGVRNGFPFYRWKDASTGKWVTGRLPVGMNIDRLHTVAGSGDSPEEYSGKEKYWVDDNCIHQTTRSCLAAFFNGSQPHDVLIFTLGMSYALHTQEEEDGRAFLNVSVDTRQWLVSSASAWRAHLAATFNGQVFRTTLAQLAPGRSAAHMTPLMKNTNEAVWPVWRPGSEDLPWYTIDQWAINEGREGLYNDHVHFNGMLTQATLQNVVNELCPGRGDARNISWPRPDLARQVVASSPAGHNGSVAALFLVDDDGNRHSLQVNSSLPSLLSYLAPFARKHISEGELALIPLGVAFPVLADGDLFRATNDKVVFRLESGVARAIYNGAVFLAHGWEWSDVKLLPPELIKMIGRGDDITV